jgi:hypothetical protein
MPFAALSFRETRCVPFPAVCVLLCSLCVHAWNTLLVAFRENQVGEINFREIATPILERVCQYWYYKLKYTNVTTEIPEFTIEPDIALELLMAANFLDT